MSCEHGLMLMKISIFQVIMYVLCTPLCLGTYLVTVLLVQYLSGVGDTVNHLRPRLLVVT